MTTRDSRQGFAVYDRGLLGWHAVLSGLLTVYTLLAASPVLAQLTPDSTLGTESSVVVPNQIIRGLPSDRITGGALRGINLFHSFQDFNVAAGQGVYFSNPVGVENILTRVTGSNPSNILGRLGVLGTANLFLLNPNGIVFGDRASLDVQGSFLATTANAIQLGDTGWFSATEPATSSLISVQPGALFLNALNPSAIANRGTLQVGGDLTLAAGNLDLKGQVQSGGNLTLRATDTLTVRDTVDTPFVARSQGNMILQGDRAIDILALNHLAQTPVVSGGDLTLISNGTISTDAHFASAGNFSVRTVADTPANFSSRYDPVITVGGNYAVGSYFGSSLKVTAGGDITYTDVIINGIDPLVHPTSPAVIFQAGGTITGTGVLFAPSGGLVVDLQAGGDITTGGILAFSSSGNAGSVTLASTGGAIATGDILAFSSGGAAGDIKFTAATGITTGTVLAFSDVGNSGAVTLTTATGNLTTANVLAFSDSGAGGAIALSASTGQITTAGNLLSFSNLGAGGTVTAIAGHDIVTSEIATFSNTSAAGAVSLVSTNGAIATGNIAANSDLGNGGGVTLTAVNGAIATGTLTANSTTSGNAGAISLDAGSGISTHDVLTSANNGNGAPIRMTAIAGDIRVNNLISNTTNGNSGDIHLTANTGGIYTNNLISLSDGVGNGGTLTLTARNDIAVKEVVSSTQNGNAGAVNFFTQNGNLAVADTVSYAAQGNGGSIHFQAAQGTVDTGLVLSYVLSGVGKSGDIALAAGGNLALSDAYAFSIDGSAGAIQLNAGGDILTHSLNTTGTLGSGNISAIAGGSFAAGINYGYGQPVTSVISSDTLGIGKGGDIQITARDISLADGAQISASTHSSGTGGTITLRATHQVDLSGVVPPGANPGAFAPAGLTGIPAGTYLGGYIPTGDARTFAGSSAQFPSGVFTQTTVGSTGNAGNLNIEAGQLVIRDQAAIAATTFGTGNAGTISIYTTESATVDHGSILSGVAPGSLGSSGDINIQTRSLNVTNGKLLTTTSGTGQGGRVQIAATEAVTLTDHASLLAEATYSGDAGTISVQTGKLTVQSGANISTSTSGQGKAGNLIITADQIALSSGAKITSRSTGTGSAGLIDVRSRDRLTVNASEISATATQAGGGQIYLTANTINLRNSSAITSSVLDGGGGGGSITIQSYLFTAFEDSDILANAKFGEGGTIQINSQVFIADLFATVGKNPGSDFSRFRGNGRVDISASSAFGVSGTVSVPDISFLQNSLASLNGSFGNTETVVTGSCLARRNGDRGSFVITGTGGLPQTPYLPLVPHFQVLTVQPTDDLYTNRPSFRSTPDSPHLTWKPGDPIQEAQGFVTLPNGRVVIGTAPQLATLAQVEELVCAWNRTDQP